MKLLLSIFAYFMILISPMYGAENEQKEEGVDSIKTKIVNDSDLVTWFETPDIEAPLAPKELHIAYAVNAQFFNKLFSPSKSLTNPRIRGLKTLSFNRHNNTYKPQGESYGFRFSDIGISLHFIANSFVKLTSLDLSYVHIERTKLNSFSSYVDITPLSSLPQLETLILKCVDLNNQSFFCLSLFKNLTELDISYNDIDLYTFGMNNENNSEEFSNLSTLVSLNISFSHAEELVHNNPFLGNLKKLEVEHNYGLSIPSLTSLTSLEILNMADTKNLKSDDLIFLSSLHNLTELDVSYNTIYERNLPQLLSITNLKKIYMSERGEYTRNIDRNNMSITISRLLQETGKHLIFKERGYEDEETNYIDVEGLITTDDVVADMDRTNRRRGGFYS